MARTRQSRTQRPVAVHDADDWDLAMRDAMTHESVEILRHQLEVERQQKAAMERGDYYMSLFVVGFALGCGYSVGQSVTKR